MHNKATFLAHGVNLKHDRSALIRGATLADAHGLRVLGAALAQDGRGMVLNPNDVGELPEFRARLMQRLEGLSGNKGALLVALIDDVIVADASIRRHSLAMIRHVAVLDVGVHPKFQGIGLGRAMMEALIEWGIQGPGRELGGVLRFELNVRADNHRAKELYLSLGFKLEGTRKGFVRTPNGFVDDSIMALCLHETLSRASSSAQVLGNKGD